MHKAKAHLQEPYWKILYDIEMFIAGKTVGQGQYGKGEENTKEIISIKK